MPDQKGATEINKLSVIPAKAGIQGFDRSVALDARLRGHDD